MTEAACAKCRSTKVLPKVRVMDRGDYSLDAGELALIVYEKPEAMIFKGPHEGSLFARVCGECGYTEMYLENPGEFYRLFTETQGKKG
ncbi:MAG TPA: hypothetical protein VEL74_07100 [Thermoanaerobaculia bacterium]|nr:hypothetical protein [Thermoanaerobaculia bacterium]